MSVAEIEAAEISLDAPTGGLWREASRRLIRNPTAIAGAVLVLIFALAAIFASVIAPYGPLDQNLSLLKPGGIPSGPSLHHLLGVDLLGRDVFTRILYGARFSLLIGVVSVAIGLSVGLVLGSIAGYIGGIVESVIMRALSKEPSKRFPDSVAFATELSEALAHPNEDESDEGLLSRMKSLFKKR